MQSPTAARPDSFAHARDRVLGRIAAACRRAGRDPAEVTLVAVSKSVPADRLVDATSAGHNLFGENRVQEAERKVALVPGARWHLLGRLQSNKARRAVMLFETIHSVDSIELAERLDRVALELQDQSATTPWAGRIPVYVQVNVDADPQKQGLRAEILEHALERLSRLDRLEAVGLMTVGRLVTGGEEARATFRALRTLSESLRANGSRLGPGLSMGMTDDYEVAVEEGATIVRIGRALFGERPPD